MSDKKLKRTFALSIVLLIILIIIASCDNNKVINNEEVPVINTTKHKTSYFALFFVIALLFGLVFYMDEAVAYYDKFYNKHTIFASIFW